MRITAAQDTLSSTDTIEVAMTALVDGQFQLPEGTELISAVYALSVSKPLLKPIKLEIQHCADIITEDHTIYLSFATASVNVGLPFSSSKKKEESSTLVNNMAAFVFLSSPYGQLSNISRDCLDIQQAVDHLLMMNYRYHL